jgi:pimeloyl-ACP methyl ester carboxylesterase
MYRKCRGIFTTLSFVTFIGILGGDALTAEQITEIPPVVDVNGNEVPGSLASLEKVTLGRVDQWILIRAQDTAKPVLLFLHGGPGGTVLPFVDLFQPAALEENFVVVHWDQRGAGKSYSPALKAEDMSVDKFVGDTLELTDVLRKRFSQDKIFLSGVSWGSALGFLTLIEDSDPFHAFIATSERGHWQRSQDRGFAWVKEQATNLNDTPILEAIAGLEPFNASNFDHLAAKNQGLDRYRGGDVYTEGLWNKYLDYAIGGQSPYYTAAEVQGYVPAARFSITTVVPQALDYDLFRDFPTSPVPVHFLTGEHDWQTPGEISRAYFEALEAPAKSYTIVEGAGHQLIYDNPDAWAAALIEIADKTLSEQ